MTRQELLTLWQTLNSFNNQTLETNFSYFIARNKAIIKDDVEAIQEAIKFPDDIQQMERNRMMIINNHSFKNNNGNPVILPNGEVMINPKTMKEYEEEIKTLEEGKEDLIKQRDEKIEEVNKFLGEEVKIAFSFKNIDLEKLPSTIDQGVMEVLTFFNLINE